MSMLQHFAPFSRSGPTSELSPFFRFLNDYTDHALSRFPHDAHSTWSSAWAPKFDIREKDDAYELQGELPGVEGKDINVEFSDNRHLRISGHTQSEKTVKSPGGEAGEAEPVMSDDKSENHQATVEDEAAEGQNNPGSSGQAVAKSSQETQVVPKSTSKWVSVERSYGRFSRSFQFSSDIDRDNVKASLKNGILRLHIPKAQTSQTKKIAIDTE